MRRQTVQLTGDLRRALEETVRRIVHIANPEAVILFGSCAEGRAREDSDLDFVVVSDTEDPGALTEDIYEGLAELARGRWRRFPSVDVVVFTSDEWEHEAQLPGMLAHRVLRRGVMVHGRAA